MTHLDDQIEATEKRLVMLRAKGQPTFRFVRTAARALDRAWCSLHDTEGTVRVGAESLALLIAEAMRGLEAYYEERDINLLPDRNPKTEE